MLCLKLLLKRYEAFRQHKGGTPQCILLSLAIPKYHTHLLRCLVSYWGEHDRLEIE